VPLEGVAILPDSTDPYEWQRWVAQGKATISNGVLCLSSPDLTAEQWAARFVTEH
jgi:hypothetical protein